MTLEQPEITHRYRPQREEVLCVAEAITLMRHVVAGTATDPRWNVGYAEGVALAMAINDPWCEDAEDGELWKQCAQMHDARPAFGAGLPARFRLKRAWFDYIRTAAEWQHADQQVA